MGLMKKNKPGYMDYCLVFLLIATTGMEYFYRSQNYILLGFIISCFAFIRYRGRLHKNLIIVLILFLVVETFQYIVFGGFNLRTFFGTYIRLLFAFIAVVTAREYFVKCYTTIIYFLSIVSLIFYFLSLLPGAENFYVNTLGALVPQIFETESGFYSEKPNIVIFNFEDTLFSSFRNSGPFWEPGGFGVFLMIALLFNHVSDKNIFSKYNAVFTLCIITTFSTATYITFFMFIIYLNFNQIRKNALYSIAFLLFISLSIVAYERIPFLKNKIEENIMLANETTSSRFGSAIADYNSFIESPLFGYGRGGAKTNFKDEKLFDADNHRNNGVFNLLVTYGIFITVFYFSKIFQAFKAIGRKYQLPEYYAFFSFLIIMVLGFSQGIFMRPFFYAFLFLPITFITSKKFAPSYNHRYV